MIYVVAEASLPSGAVAKTAPVGLLLVAACSSARNLISIAALQLASQKQRVQRVVSESRAVWLYLHVGRVGRV